MISTSCVLEPGGNVLHEREDVPSDRGHSGHAEIIQLAALEIKSTKNVTCVWKTVYTEGVRAVAQPG